MEDKSIAVTEKMLYVLTIVFGVINLFGLAIGSSNVENRFLIIATSGVLIIIALIGLLGMKKGRSEEQRHNLIFNTLYLDFSLGLCVLFLLVSPRLLEAGLLVVSLIASIGWVLTGIIALWREKAITKTPRWL